MPFSRRRIASVGTDETRLYGLGGSGTVTITTPTVPTTLTRITFNDIASYTGAYSVTLNPSELDFGTSSNVTVSETFNTPAISYKQFNDTPIVFSWSGIRADYSGFLSMLATLNSYIDDIKYVHFGDADYTMPTLGWVKTRVANLKVEIRYGGSLRYDVEMTLFPEY